MKVAITAVVAVALAGCGHMAGSGDGWKPLFNGANLESFNRVGDANWRIDGQVVVADRGSGFLVTKEEFGDFSFRAEFYAEADTNSGIFIRCTDKQKLDSKVCYEVNIWDDRPEKDYATGAIVGVAKVDPMPKSVGQWNVYEITAKGDTFTVVLNGKKTVEGKDNKHAKGLIALQHGLGNKDAAGVANDKGVIKFRKVEIKALSF